MNLIFIFKQPVYLSIKIVCANIGLRKYLLDGG
jgi:hypothetical protein